MESIIIEYHIYMDFKEILHTLNGQSQELTPNNPQFLASVKVLWSKYLGYMERLVFEIPKLKSPILGILRASLPSNSYQAYSKSWSNIQ